MAKIVAFNGEELSGSDKGLLATLVTCGDLKYVEKEYVRSLLMPQYTELLMAEGHPLNVRLAQLKEVVKNGVRARINRTHKVKPKKRDK